MTSSQTAGPAEVAGTGWLAPGLTLSGAGRAFSHHVSPRILGPAILVAITARVALAGWGWRDAVIPLAIVTAEPFTEWLIHVHLLHFRARTVRGRRVDLLLAIKHRAHHRDPRDPVLVFVPTRVLVSALIGGVVGWGLAFRSARPALTALASSMVMLLGYEWTHFLIHSAYRPKRALYRGIWRAHRLHHYRNERFWFGVTMHLADRMLRTYPAREAVPPSATARTLGVDAAGAL